MTVPQKAESRGLQSPAFPDHTHNIVDFAAARDSCKAVASLKARFAIAGHQVYDGGNNDFIVTRWGMTRHCQDLAALRIFARVLGVQA
jgi:hypothetical protein